MRKHQSAKPFVFYLLFILYCGNLAGNEVEQPVSLEQQVEGLWLYTGLITSSGEDLPLNGIFLFRNGVFVQYAQSKGEPAQVQGAMAHADIWGQSKNTVSNKGWNLILSQIRPVVGFLPGIFTLTPNIR